MPNSYPCSDGTRVSKKTIDYRVRKAKSEKLQEQLDEYGYNFCTRCGRNDCKPLDCAHIKSVDWCQKNGCAELAWDKDNIEIIGRVHHQEQDGLDLRFSSST